MPDKIGKYEIRGTLGRGAMGTVLDGWDPAIERRVAIKTVRLADAAADEEAAEALERFKREAQAAGRLSHANIVGVFDTGETDELAYIVMEFIEGRSLKQLLDTEKSLPPDEAAEIMSQVLAGLEYSHRRGVIHRDIKPANIMLTTDGGIKIADFGIARLSSSTATAVGSILGTPAYMPPEQFLGEPADARSDIFAAGAMLFHLLTGTRPYEGNATSIMTRVLNADAPPLPSERSVSVSPAWDKVILKAMAKRPEDRFQSAAEFSQAIKTALSAPAAARSEPESDATMVMAAPRAHLPKAPSPPAPSTAAPKKQGSTTPLLLGGGGLAIAIVAVGAYLLFAPVAKPPALPPALSEPKPAAPAPVAQTPPSPNPVKSPEPDAGTPPPPPPGTVKGSITEAASSIACSFAQGEIESGKVILRGIAGAGAPRDALDQLAHAAALPVTPDIDDFTGPYCPMLDVLAPILRDNELQFTATDKSGPVTAKEYFFPTIRNLPIGAWVQVDYLSGDGTVFHVLPMAKDKKIGMAAEPAIFLPADATLRLGEPPHNKLFPGTPYGKDMFVALASTEKLFPGPRPQFEKIAPYAEALKSALQSLQAKGGKIAAGVVIVKTIEK